MRNNAGATGAASEKAPGQSCAMSHGGPPGHRRLMVVGLGFAPLGAIAAGEGMPMADLWLPALVVIGILVGLLARLAVLQRRLARSEKVASRFHTIFHYADIGMAFGDHEGTIIIANPTFDAMLDYQPGQTQGMNFQEFTHDEDTKSELRLLEELLARRREFYRLEKRYIRRDGSDLWVDATITVVRDASGQPINFVGMIIDISARRRAQDELHRLAVLDHLTNVANRLRFDQRLEEEWRRLSRESSPLGLIMLDVDEFKAYNDHHGHPAGDEVLRQVSGALSRSISRAADMVARYGGEEFVLLLPNTDWKGTEQLAKNACRAVEALQIPHPSAQHHEWVTVSAGYAVVAPEPGRSAETLIRMADQALYEAKGKGRNRVEPYVPEAQDSPGQ